MVVFPFVYCITHTFPSYRHPTEPVLLLLASYAAIRAVRMAGAWLSPANHRGTAAIQLDALMSEGDTSLM
jgi:hypothetical protein